LQSGKIGEIRAIRILFRQHVPDILKPDHPIYQLNHSILVDMANHHFDLIRFLTYCEFSKVIAFEYETPENVFRCPSSAFCLLTLDNGVSVTWDGDWCHDHPRTSWEGAWEFIGSDARMFWRGEQDSENRNRYHPVISIEGSDGSTEKIPFQESIGDRRVPVLDHFIESILHARQPEPSVWDNVRVLRAVFGCIESSWPRWSVVSPQERSTAFSAAAIGIRFFFARDSDWLRELESEKPLRLPLLPSVEAFPSFCCLSHFCRNRRIGRGF
jgi:predicted dehydrogenase